MCTVPPKKKVTTKANTASEGFIKLWSVPENNHKGFLLLFPFLLYICKCIKMEIECEESREKLLFLQTK